MADIRDFRDLIAWQKARQLVALAYRLSGKFPPDERFGLCLQMRRAAVSVPSNIAEGYGRGSREDYSRFLKIARGSLYELQTKSILSVDLGFAAEADCNEFEAVRNDCSRLLHGLIQSLRA